MKFILVPLMSIGIFVAVVTAQPQIPFEINNANANAPSEAAASASKTVGSVYAFWPNKQEGEDSRVIEITDDNGITDNYIAIFKDPKDNAYDLSSEDALEKAFADEESLTPGSTDFDKLDSMVMFSVYLDKENKVLYSVPGTNVPTSWKEVKNVQNAIARAVISKLDPSMPGVEDIKDPNAAMVQLILNSIAMQGPEAMEEAKKDPVLMDALDAAYEASKEWEEMQADLDVKIAQEESEKRKCAFVFFH
ncbi:hypothetical protein EDD21DRAFT_386266 [Dissophora ornata]|nr:hypothetical protein EDD21DRAFT_386266 [Dissophora ornata]